MGVPARRIEAEPFRRSHLQVVPDPPARSVRRPSAAPAAARARARTEEARAKALFTTFLAGMLCAVLLGGVRVAIIVRAAEASLSENRIEKTIRDARAVGDQLEVQRSSLSSPSRIAGIATASMRMGEPKSVNYITMPAAGDAAPSASPAPSSSKVSAANPVQRALGAIVALSAGEAQSLLLGDLGLAGSR